MWFCLFPVWTWFVVSCCVDIQTQLVCSMINLAMSLWSSLYSTSVVFCICNIELLCSLVQLFVSLVAQWSTNDTSFSMVDRPSFLFYDCTASTLVIYHRASIRLLGQLPHIVGHSATIFACLQDIPWLEGMSRRMHGSGEFSHFVPTFAHQHSVSFFPKLFFIHWC